MTPERSGPEDKARHDLINPMLKKAGWAVQHYREANIYISLGVAVEYFPMGMGVGEADYVLFIDGKACGIIEAKKEGETLIGKEPQTSKYALGFPKDFQYVDLPLPFNYESTGSETRFTNLWDPKPRSRELFFFHSPNVLADWIKQGKHTLRQRLSELPPVDNPSLWRIQEKAIVNLEESLKIAKPRALIQMATGSGKTFTAVNVCYRLIRYAKVKRILYLVDRGNLADPQTTTEFQTFVVPGDGRKFTDIYNVQCLKSNLIDDVSNVCIATIQRVYSMLKGEKDLDPIVEEHSSFEDNSYNLGPARVEYNPSIPISMFDVIIIDECHRSIYNLWKQVLDYFDAFLIGLTATPAKSNDRVKEIFNELQTSDVKKIPNLYAAGLRLLLELGTYIYMERNRELDKYKNSYLAKESKSKRMQVKEVPDTWPNLKDLLKWLIENDSSIDKKIRNALRKYIDQKGDEPVLDDLNSFMHNPSYVPTKSLLSQKWKQLSEYLRHVLRKTS